ncbi:MAG: PAS domain S-box protein [Ignavibacteria bacterium]|nr:PAS domain S-box protein [Ignavibacteria bacterium]
MKNLVSGNNRYIFGIIASVIMFAAIGFISFNKMNDDIEAGNEIERSYEIINTVNNIQNHLKDLGLMRSGLMLTGDLYILEQYPGSDTEIKRSIESLIALTSYDPHYEMDLMVVSRSISQRLLNLKNSINLYKTEKSYSSFQYAYTVVNRPLVKMNNMIFDGIKSREKNNLKNSSAEENKAALSTKILLIAGNVSALLILIYSTLRLKRYNKLILNEIELRKTKEQQLIEKQLEVEKLSNLSPVGIFHLEAGLSFTYANETMTSLTGYENDHLLKMNIVNLIHDEDKERFNKEWKRIPDGNRGFKSEFRIRQKSGKPFYAICEFARQFEGTGKLKGYICSLTDITKLHEYQEELVKYNLLFEGITEGIPDPVMVKDFKGVYEFVNSAAADFIGREREDIIGKTDSDLLSPEVAEEISAKEKIVLSDGISINYELCAVHPDGTLKTFLSTKGVLRNSKNRIIGLFGIARDVTQLKKKEEEISKSLKEKETLLKEIHHRVKNNLQIVASLLRLQSGYVKDPESKKYFLDSQNRIHSMAIIHEKLYGSKSLAEIDLKLYLEQLVSNLVYSLDIDTLKIKIITEIASLNIDLDHAIPVGLIVNEILTNSFKYAFPGEMGGEIIIKAAEDKDIVSISLSDNGVGFPGNTNIKDYDSLGLQLVQTLTESQLSGKLEMKSTGGGGVNFEISFPYHAVSLVE